MSALRMAVGVALKTLEDVVSFQPQCRGALRRRNRADTAAAQKHDFFTLWHGSLEAFLKRQVHRHAGPLLPGQRY